MTQDEIIEMAREAGLIHILDEHAHEYGNGTFENTSYPELEAFANLVAAKATEEANARANASWELMCKKMVAFEREACAKVCEEEGLLWGRRYATAIRARGQA